MEVLNCLRRIGKNPINFKNSFPLIKHTFLLVNQINYVEFFSKYTSNLGIRGEGTIQVISYIGQKYYYQLSDNHYN